MVQINRSDFFLWMRPCQKNLMFRNIQRMFVKESPMWENRGSFVWIFQWDKIVNRNRECPLSELAPKSLRGVTRSKKLCQWRDAREFSRWKNKRLCQLRLECCLECVWELPLRPRTALYPGEKVWHSSRGETWGGSPGNLYSDPDTTLRGRGCSSTSSQAQ